MKIIKTFFLIVIALATLAGSLLIENQIKAKAVSELNSDVIVYAGKR